MEDLKTIEINYSETPETINISNQKIYNLTLLDVAFKRKYGIKSYEEYSYQLCPEYEKEKGQLHIIK